MTFEIFLILLLGVSVATGLFTQAVKSLLQEHGVNYYANTLAGIVAAVVSVAACVGYAVITGITVDPPYIVCSAALLALSWLSAMVGYDKVMQAITQIKTYGTENKEE